MVFYKAVAISCLLDVMSLFCHQKFRSKIWECFCWHHCYTFCDNYFQDTHVTGLPYDVPKSFIPKTIMSRYIFLKKSLNYQITLILFHKDSHQLSVEESLPTIILLKPIDYFRIHKKGTWKEVRDTFIHKHQSHPPDVVPLLDSSRHQHSATKQAHCVVVSSSHDLCTSGTPNYRQEMNWSHWFSHTLAPWK